MDAKLKVGGVFKFQCWEHFHEDGTKCLDHKHCKQPHIDKLKWEAEAKNAVTTEGLSHILDVEFHGTTQVATWYIGLIKTDYTHAAGDTLASHAGWTEAVPGTDYTGDRLAWTEGAASSGVMINGSTVDFPCLTTITLKGALLASVATGTSGKLFCTAAFSGGDQAVNNGDTLKATYTITATAA